MAPTSTTANVRLFDEARKYGQTLHNAVVRVYDDNTIANFQYDGRWWEFHHRDEEWLVFTPAGPYQPRA